MISESLKWLMEMERHRCTCGVDPRDDCECPICRGEIRCGFCPKEPKL